MPDHRYDLIIIGTGAGGGTMARALADTDARILVVERGDFIPQEEENWSPEAVWKDRRYRAAEAWTDGDDETFSPYTHYCVGGNTKFWGSALFRLRREDFMAVPHEDGLSPAWPIDYETLAPYYDRAEALYEVHGAHGIDPTEPPRGPFPFPPVRHAPRMTTIVERFRRRGLQPFPLPLGIRDTCIPCLTCNSYACKLHAKSEADVCCVRPVLHRPNVTLWTNAYATRLVTNGAGTRVTAVEIQREGATITAEAPLCIVSCGAINSAALLLRSAGDRHPTGLANSSGLVGRRYMAHLATMISARHWRRKNDIVFQKTVGLNDFYNAGSHTPVPLGHVQSQGRTDALVLKSEAPSYARRLPLSWYEWWASKAVDWLVMTEDLPLPDNRVTLTADGGIRLHYVPSNTRAHARLVNKMRRMLLSFGLVPVTHSLGTRNTTHQCGTLVFGTDPRASVLDPFCRTHDVENLFVVDASFFPSSAAVNPGLTIVAQALRTADHIRETVL